jgi:homoserine O-succinyltransferase
MRAMASRLENGSGRQPASPKLRRARAPDLRVALVNNMPDAALAATERQFVGLVEASRGELTVRMDFYALSGVPRSAETRIAMAQRYGALDDLIAAAPDMLIVTGAEPRAADLVDEPYWSELTRLIDWARSGALAAALYSCLAAHAAVRIADCVQRRRLPAKLCGVYAADVVQSHELTEGLATLLTPHSRYNDLDERELTDNGYVVLTRSGKAGVDAFVKEGATLEAFWQGHPEYEADTLARELRRDLQRFVGDATRAPPPLPENYLTPDVYAGLEAYVADVANGDVLTAETLTLPTLAPETAFWAKSSRQLMGAFLAAAFRRKRGGLRTRLSGGGDG